ncbi:MAG TPA: hypothetical protein VMO00_12980 [Methylomirabilota bacterium]|nr:hypothetical protein [Methylomirabilota bacterium]
MATTTLPGSSTPKGPLVLNYQGIQRDKVGQDDLGLSADGLLDGTFSATLQSGSSTKTIERLYFMATSGGLWNTIQDTKLGFGSRHRVGCFATQ